MEYKNKLKEYSYYLIVGAISLFIAVFFPMLGSTVSGSFQWPATKMEWAIFIGTKAIVTLASMLILSAFIKAGKQNILNDPRYLAAIGTPEAHKIAKVASPKTYYTGIWLKKGITTLATSVASCFVIAEAVLTYNYSALIAYSLSVGTSVICGIMTMLDIENYWTQEFPIYIQQQNEQNEQTAENETVDAANVEVNE